VTVSDPTEPHNGNGDSEPLAAAVPVVAVPPVAPVDDDDLLDVDDPDLDTVDLGFDAPVIAPMVLPDDGLPDDHAIDDLVGDLVPPDLEERLARLESSQDGVTSMAPDDFTQRLARLEQAAQALAAAEVDRDGRRVRRKVSAASLGAFAAAAIPVILQLAGAFDLPPEVTSAISAGAALIGAFAAGWSTPERKPSLPTDAVQGLIAG
jgi:hypothetical protein